MSEANYAKIAEGKMVNITYIDQSNQMQQDDSDDSSGITNIKVGKIRS